MRKLLKWLGYTAAAFLLLLLAGAGYLYAVAVVDPPKPADFAVLELERTQLDSTTFTLGNNWLRRSQNGWWELYAEGAPFERGVITGKLAKDLVEYQEQAFFEQICKLVPSAFYRQFLKYFIAYYNRNLESNLTEEQKLEIYGISRSASEEFDYIGPAYQRIMNYHAAHDIGHALQNLALVGCSSFAAWDEKAEDGKLILGRNFDFYVGEKFAENKMLAFFSPDSGHQFMIITWGGMTGAVSGMNQAGLTVTINAAKSDLPAGSATPVSLLAREILQYAGDLNQALAIASKRQTFVSESIMVGSAADNKAVVIEKTPDDLQVHESNSNQLVCTNHYQSTKLGGSEVNRQHMDESASVYRQERIQELLSETEKMNPARAAAILRNQLGQGNKFVGYGNEKVVNQLIAHHSVIFEPHKRLIWVASAPWQLGQYTAYDLNKIFGMKGLAANAEVAEPTVIPADTFLSTEAYGNFVSFRQLSHQLQAGEKVNGAEFIRLNPEYYHAYVLAGNAWYAQEDFAKAKAAYEGALTKLIASKTEEAYIRKQIEKCTKKLAS